MIAMCVWQRGVEPGGALVIAERAEEACRLYPKETLPGDWYALDGNDLVTAWSDQAGMIALLARTWIRVRGKGLLAEGSE